MIRFLLESFRQVSDNASSAEIKRTFEEKKCEAVKSGNKTKRQKLIETSAWWSSNS